MSGGLVGLHGKSIVSRDRTKVVITILHQKAGLAPQKIPILDAEVDGNLGIVQGVLEGAKVATLKHLQRVGAIQPTAPTIPTQTT